MRCIHIIHNPPDNRLQIGSSTIPEPNSHQVLIRVKAAGINRPDWMQRQGLYPPPPGASPILGLEVAGTIAAIGHNVEGWAVGDEVCALLTGGGYSEYVLASPTCVLPIPSGFDPIAAAALPECLFTVWSNLFMRGKHSPGESVLIHGGGSGIGTTAIQLAKAMGASVYVTAGTAEKCRRCLDLGADAAINYRQEDFVERIASLTASHGVDVILDIIGGDYLNRNLQCLASEGRLLQIAIQNGNQAQIKLWPILAKRLTITGSTLRGRDDAYKGEIARQLRTQVWPLLAQGRCKPVIDSVFPLTAAEQAHQRLIGGDHFGKIMLEI